MNNLLQNLSDIKYTENGSLAYKSTNSALYDLFAFGGAYRSRSEEDCISLFKNAYEENPEYALKCLFWLRDCRGGAGERRFWRVCAHWLACTHPEAAIRNIKYVPVVGRWDDLFCLFDTKSEDAVLDFIKHQLASDLISDKPSLCAKWMPSINATSAETRKKAIKIRDSLFMSSRTYRRFLSDLRNKIKIVERTMSANEWDKINYSAVPSKAGLQYARAFQKHDPERYNAFINDKNTSVHAGVLYPYDCVHHCLCLDTPDEIVNKYWDNLTDYFSGATLNGLCVVDTSGSMYRTPIEVAISLGLYCAERAKGPFENHFITFASRPELLNIEGNSFAEKARYIESKELVDNTNLQAVFDLILATAIKNHCPQSDIPQKIIIISDMEIDTATYDYSSTDTVMEQAREKWTEAGYQMPNLVYWNVAARHNTILDKDPNVSYVSGCSPVLFEQILKNKTGIEIMWDKLNSERYKEIS